MRSETHRLIQSAFAWCTLVHLRQPNCFVFEEIEFATLAEAQKAALDIFANARGFAEGDDPYITRCFEKLEDHWEGAQRQILHRTRTQSNNANVGTCGFRQGGPVHATIC